MSKSRIEKIRFDGADPGGLEIVRAIVLQRLHHDHHWKQLDAYGEGFDPYVEYVGQAGIAKDRVAFLAMEVMWEFMIQGVIAPGLNPANPNLPWFHITEYGQKVLAAGEYLPHDPTGYLDRFVREMPDADSTVLAYLRESVDSFARGSFIASVVLLGIASERVFLLVAESLLTALSNPKEQKQFKKILDRNAIKPKLDWVLAKVLEIRTKFPGSVPDNINVMPTTIFDFIRCQRNDLGHPQNRPPKVSREDAYVNLRIFPAYCRVADQVRTYLNSQQV